MALFNAKNAVVGKDRCRVCGNATAHGLLITGVPPPLDNFVISQVILPELWDAAVELFDASRAGVVSDRKRTQKAQEKVTTWCRHGDFVFETERAGIMLVQRPSSTKTNHALQVGGLQRGVVEL